MKKGDIVTVDDGSSSVRVDRYQKNSDLHGICEDQFEVLNVCFNHDNIIGYGDTPVHNIFIKNTRTGAIYLHSMAMISVVSKAKPKVKELTISQIESKFGCKVKIIK